MRAWKVVLAIFILVTSASFLGADSSQEFQKIQGAWEISAMIDSGELVPGSLIKQKLVDDGRLTISGQFLTFLRPGTKEKRQLPFVINPNATPKTMDIAGVEKTGSKGIYLLDGDTLIVCLGGPESTERPADFSSQTGSQHLLMTLKRVNKPTPVQEVKAANISQPTAPVAVSRDEEYRRTLVGTWGHQDDEKIEMTTWNADGTFSTTRTWKKKFQRIFHEDIRSSGMWKVKDGVVIVQVTASNEQTLRNQVFSYRISSLTPTQAFFTDQDGRARVDWKAR